MAYRALILAALGGIICPLDLVASPMAQDSALAALLFQHRHAVRLENGALAGPGGALLLEEGRAARYALLGEEHGVAEISLFTAAWLGGLVPAGYRHLAVEVGPSAGRLLDSLAGEGPEALRRFQLERPPGFPFFILRQESELLVAARRAFPLGRGAIWGIDYDIMGDRYLLERLERVAPNSAARRVVAELKAMSDSGIAVAARTGNPGAILLFSALDQPFERLREAFRPEPGSYADEVIETLQETAAINRLFVTRQNYESNLRRAQFNKRWFAIQEGRARAGAAERPRVMVKLGAGHTYRGLSPTRQYDIGAMLAQLAEAEGDRSFHVLVVGGPGTRHAVFNPVKLAYEAQLVSAIAADHPLSTLALPDVWSLFDVRPLRPAIHNRRVRVDDRTFELAFNFDAILVMSGSTPATPWFDAGSVLLGRPSVR